MLMNEDGQKSDFYHQDEPVETVYDSTKRDTDDSSATPDTSLIEWSASEFVDHQKSVFWFMALGLVSFIISAIVYLATKDVFGPVIITILALIFGVGAARRPRILQYSLDDSGLTIGEKHYPYELFKAFSLMNEGPIESLVLVPTKRWNPGLSIYYAPEDADNIMNTLGSFVPYEERTPGYTDKFLHKIRF